MKKGYLLYLLVRAYAQLARLESHWATVIGRHFGPSVYHIKTKESQSSAFPKDTRGEIAGISPHCACRAERQAGTLWKSRQ